MALPSMAPPGMGVPISPDALLQMSLAVKQILEAQAELLMQPQYPKWYRPEDYPKPNAAKALEKATQLEAEFAVVRNRMLEEIKLARGEKSGIFKSDKDDADSGDLDIWTDTAIQGEIELIAYQLADSTLSFDATPRKRDDEEEAAKKVDFAQACMEHSRTLHARSGNGNLALEKAKTLLTTGRLAWHCMLNLDADEGEMPFIEQLVDPTSCFPVFEAHRGMRLMVRKYQTTIGEAVAQHDTVDNALTAKFILEPMARNPDKHKRREEEACEVTEYWDRRWRVIFIDGEIAKEPMEHAYGFVPFVYMLSALGLPAYMRDPASQTGSVGTTGFGSTWHHRDAAMQHKGVGLPSVLKQPTALREAIYSRMLTAYGKFVDPPIVVEADDITHPQGVPEISRKRGDASLIKMGHQSVQDIVAHPNSNVLAPILQGVSDNSARVMLPPTAHGQNDHSNVSGYATQGLNEAGRIKLVPWLKTLEDFERECMMMRFRMFRDHGWMVNTASEGGDYGTIIVPRHEAMPGEDQVVDLSPGDLKRAGIDINVNLTFMPLQMLGPVANAIGILMQLGIEDEIGAMKLLNVPNPYKKLERIRDNKFYNDPDYLEAKALQKLSRTDPDLAAYFMVKKQMQMQAEQMEQAGPPAGPTGPPGAMGDSQAAMGRPPGPGSGPPGPMPPTSEIGTEP